jgi:hypothetical protein
MKNANQNDSAKPTDEQIRADPLGTGLPPEGDDDWNDGEGEWVYFDQEKGKLVSFYRKSRRK